jgi:hypothetical protein
VRKTTQYLIWDNQCPGLDSKREYYKYRFNSIAATLTASYQYSGAREREDIVERCANTVWTSLPLTVMGASNRMQYMHLVMFCVCVCCYSVICSEYTACHIRHGTVYEETVSYICHFELKMVLMHFCNLQISYGSSDILPCMWFTSTQNGFCSNYT